MKFKKFTLLGLAAAAFAESTAAIPTPPELWRDFDPDHGDYKEEIIQGRRPREGQAKSPRPAQRGAYSCSRKRDGLWICFGSRNGKASKHAC